MNAGTKLSAYGFVLAAALGGGAVLGAVAGPFDVGADEAQETPPAGAPAPPEPQAAPAGLAIAENGYRLVPEDRLADEGEFAFTILGPDGSPTLRFEELHERELHLIVASRDLQQFAHVHPTRDATGRWSVDLPVLPPGAYRAFADFQPVGAQAVTLGADVIVPGEITAPVRLGERRTTTVGPFDVELRGDLRAGDEAEVTVTVRRGGEVVTTDPYLGAAGHLVALRDGDLAYLHVHPLDDRPSGPVRFAVEAPSPGAYGLFFDFVVGGELHTARFIVTADSTSGTPDPTAGSTTTTAPPAGHDDDHGH